MKSFSLAILGLGLVAMPLAAQQTTSRAPRSDRTATGAYCQTMQDGMSMVGMMGDWMGTPEALLGSGGTGSSAGVVTGGTRSGGMMGGGGATATNHPIPWSQMMNWGGGVGMPAAGVMMQAVRLSPRYLLAHRDQLALTTDQVRKLQRVARRAPSDTTGDAEMAAAQGRLADAFNHNDVRGMRSASGEMASVRASQLSDELARAAEVRAVLTPRQLDQLSTLAGGCQLGHTGSGALNHRATQGTGMR